MTTSEYLRHAVADTLNDTSLTVNLKAALKANGLDNMTAEVLSSVQMIKSEQFPRIYVFFDAWSQRDGSAGGTGTGVDAPTRRNYPVKIIFGVKSSAKERDVMGVAGQVADCICAVLESNWDLPACAVEGIVSSSFVTEARLSRPMQVPKTSNYVRIGEMTFEAVVGRQMTTHGGE